MSSDTPHNPEPFRVALKRLRVPDQDLLADLKQVAKKLRRRRLSQTEYTAHGRFPLMTIVGRFAGWRNALARANLKPARLHDISAELVIQDIRRVAAKLKVQKLPAMAYRTHAVYSITVAVRHYGSWEAAVLAAGLTPCRPRPKSREDLLENIRTVWLLLGRQPMANDLNPRLSKFNLSAYVSEFGNFNSALAAFATWQGQTMPMPGKVCINTSPRAINLTLRFAVLRRDFFRCQTCGTSPATNPSVELEVDHKIPWSHGGQTVLENLQTLCQKCNRGKSDSPAIET